MKTCVHCGAVLKDENCSVCSECGCVLQVPTLENGETKGKKKKKPYVSPVIEINTDGYYNDRVPEDAEKLKADKPNSSLGIKLGMLIFAVVLIISACVVGMTLM